MIAIIFDNLKQTPQLTRSGQPLDPGGIFSDALFQRKYWAAWHIGGC